MIDRSKTVALAVALMWVLALPVAAGADALPDGRVYEQVSPVAKDAFDAGAPGGSRKYSLATADGNGMFYGVRGPVGTVHRGLQEFAIGRRTADGWTSESALPAGSSDRIFATTYSPWSVVPSADLTRALFVASGTYVADNPETLATSGALYEGHMDGTVDWLSRPLIPNPVPAPGGIPSPTLFQPVGGTPDLGTVYFWAQPTLLPTDAARASGSGWGLYEYRNGVLESAGTLPDGSEDPGGAAPAATGTTTRDNYNFTSPETASNQVSRDGTKLWFVSPDPGTNPTLGSVTQLYLRRGGHSVLVSHLPGDPTAPAPDGASPVRAYNGHSDNIAHEYVYGAPDGTAAIFRSTDALTSDAPSDSSQKAYRYDVATGTVSYLAGVDGVIGTASDDAQRFLFENDTQIALWDHGTVTTVALIQGTPGNFSPARTTASGSSFVFSSIAPIAGFNNAGSWVQIYRYDVAQDKLTCLSCPPDGITPSGDAHLSSQDAPDQPTEPAVAPRGELIPSRGMSADGGRVFFDTPESLVVRDTNGKRDVYEWTAQGVSLISSGRSQDNSFFMDNSADGDDVFFATAEGLDPADFDGGYDVYDARVGGGFTSVVKSVPCVSDACQGGVSGPARLPAPGSRRAAGPGDQEAPTAAPVVSAKVKLGSRRLVKGVLEVSVKIARPGRVSVSGGGLRSVVKSYAKPGVFMFRVPLSVAAKRSLAAKHRLKVSVRVGFTPSSGPASSVKFVFNAKA
jgi:hypothetical protein